MACQKRRPFWFYPALSRLQNGNNRIRLGTLAYPVRDTFAGSLPHADWPDTRRVLSDVGRRQLSIRDEFNTTNIEDALWISAPTTGFRNPRPDSSTPHTLTIQANTMMFCRIICAVRLESASVNGNASILSAIKAISAVSTATSVPAAPIAMPTSASASAGASLIPSPTIATFSPCF